MRGIDSFADRLVMLTTQDIDNLNKDSHIAYLKALYDCQNFVLVDLSHTPTLNKKTFIQNFGYKDDFYLSFLSNKSSISNEYLEARKVLYKTIMNLRKEREQDYKEERDRNSQLSYEEYTRKQRDKQRQQRNQSNQHFYNKDTNQIILQSQDKSITIIFLDKINPKDLVSTQDSKQYDSFISMSNLIHIHNNKIDIFTKDKTYLDIQSLLEDYQDYGITQDILNSPSTQIFFYSHLLTGGTQSPNPLFTYFFGTLDSKSSIGLDESLPIYHFSPKDKEYNLGTLLIFLNSYTLTLLNYSLIDSSLNIKLELTNKEFLKYFKYNQSITHYHWSIENAA